MPQCTREASSYIKGVHIDQPLPTTQFLLSQPLGITILLSTSMRSTVLCFSYDWDYIVVSFLCSISQLCDGFHQIQLEQS